ncbi:uncharacterized protein [Aegilops tauschii subsp. strangulata]|uniref:uncharacterized protein n=1 Tax=Aegilops tauschii subsp. strangulata TaxID=200361 RepID=UPI00098ACBE6|nr:uncharacterized protein LOC109765845 [Aegilops tauschii subsp. strangulata]
MSTSVTVRRPCLLTLAAILAILLSFPPETAQYAYGPLLNFPPLTAQVSYDPPWSDEFWANEAVLGAEADVAARRAEAGGYAYGCARLWLAWGCPPAPGEGVNGTLVHGRRSYDRELDRFEEERRQCRDDRVPRNHPEEHLFRRTYPATTFDLRCCACCFSCGRYY